MSSEPQLQCAEPACQFAENPLGQRVCVQCETPLRYRYLWVVGEHQTPAAVGETIGDRYYVAAPQTWLDLRPATPPATPAIIPAIARPYLQAHPYRLHLPGLYDVWPHDSDQAQAGEPEVDPKINPEIDPESENAAAPASPPAGEAIAPILLLENEPFDGRGQLCPTLTSQWANATAVRQCYWLWQMLELWPTLADWGLAASLQDGDNLHVAGWRLRLRELRRSPAASPATLADLATLWQTWLPHAQGEILAGLTQLCEHMQAAEVSLEQVRRQLNQLLLAQSAQLSLRLTVSGATHPGAARSHNEDSCYPDTEELKRIPPQDPTRVPQLAIVCDGIGGHEGGEVASQLVVRSLRPQMQALLTEVAEQPDIVTPDTIISQMEAAIRVANNLVDFQNTSQGRSERQRMGTTLALALVIPQRVQTATGWGQAHELYLAHVGDSRAYWLTPDYCHELTVDDDMAGRETIAAQKFYADAQRGETAMALTQALGTRPADYLHPHIQRFLIEEDGVLLLCSDGLSDGDRVEQSWRNYIALIVREMVPLESVVAKWIELANAKNGHDNIAIVLMQCQAETILPVPSYQQTTGAPAGEETELTEASRALLYGEGDSTPSSAPPPVTRSPGDRPVGLNGWILRILGALVIMAAVSAIAWWQLSRSSAPPTPPPDSPTQPAPPEN